ncbi:MAG TPA: SURF1 family protein [Actinoplanes sp.]|nr:SURF1 family protein [Actinoplanes sp.]
MYRFLLRPSWLGALALAVAAAVAMVFLGIWQLHRYQERTAINDRIDAADSAPAAPLTTVLPAPTSPGSAGHPPAADLVWTKVSVTGRYDPTQEIQARGRTVNGDVGFEIVTPLVLADGTAVLVDRGWIPPAGDALAAPTVPPAPTGQVTVVGQVHRSESRPTPVIRRDGRLDTRRISVPRLAREMPYPVYGAYVLLTNQTPAADPAFVPIPIDHEDAWQNAGYTVQWWLFALMPLVGFGWQARREARGEGAQPGRRLRAAASDGPAPPIARASPPAPAALDRVAESDRRAAARAAAATDDDPLDRVAESDRRAAARAADSARGAGADGRPVGRGARRRD